MPVATTTAILAGGALLGAGASVYSANKAADAQKKAAAQAGALEERKLKQIRADLAPYREAGTDALDYYLSFLGAKGPEAAAAARSRSRHAGG